VTRALQQKEDQQRYAIGIGVEDPAFGGFRSHSDSDEISRWVPILRDFDTVSVRGPRSAELLADVGFTVTVSGDPALLLPSPDVEPQPGLIGVNLGFGDDLWGHDPNALVAETAQALRQLSAGGYEVVGILMNPDDDHWTRTALEGLGSRIVMPRSASDAADVLARCSVAIVTRLHAAILASLSGTPVVAFEYQPKCRDFAMSINDVGSLIRTDKLTATAIVDCVEIAAADAPEIRRRKRAAVDTLRERLSTQYSLARARLGVAG
jgi:polysaccharide pyruvyl transferase WcaK-like protein